MHVRGKTLVAAAVALCLLGVGAGIGAGLWAGRHYAHTGPVGPEGARGPAGPVGKAEVAPQLDLTARAEITDMIEQQLTGTVVVAALNACPPGTTELPLTTLAATSYRQWEVEGWLQDMLAKQGLMSGLSTRKISADYTLQYSVCRH
jgi:hypothetical protein